MKGSFCEYCKGVENRHIGGKYKICGYCMQPVNVEKTSSKAEIVGKESVSFITTSGITAFALFGLEMPFFNSFIFGVLSAVILVGMVKPAILVLKSFGLFALFLLFAREMVDLVVYLVDQIILYFQLKEQIDFHNNISLTDYFFPNYS